MKTSINKERQAPISGASEREIFGLIEASRIHPLLAHFDQKGEIQGRQMDRIGVVMINAVKEQQAQIEQQQTQITQQQAEIDDLRSIICSIKPQEKICQK